MGLEDSLYIVIYIVLINNTKLFNFTTVFKVSDKHGLIKEGIKEKNNHVNVWR